MIATTKSLLALTARDLMSRDVVVIPKEMSLRGAAHLLLNGRISGAPVANSEGRCIGVVSSTDFVHWARADSSAAKPRAEQTPHHCAWQVFETADELPNNQVGDYMTNDPVTVPPQTRLAQLARIMRDAHIHRVIVVDDERRPIGIVSSTDILAAVAGTRDPN